METNIRHLIDFEKVDTLLEGFNKSTGFVTAILDLEGNVLSKSGWRQMCTEFHRVNPETSKKCTISDTELANKMGEGEKYHFYKCLNGLVDVAVPVVINGEHVANLFSGQFFFEEPDATFFKKQAEKYGFDEGKYLTALKNVPVVSEEKVKTAMDFLLAMTLLISDLALEKAKKAELNKQISEGKVNAEESEEKYRALYNNAPLSYQSLDENGCFIDINPMWSKTLGYERDEVIGKWYGDFLHPDFVEHFRINFPAFKKRGYVSDVQFKLRRKDNTFIYVSFEGCVGYTPEGKFKQTYCVFKDITEQKALENAIIKAKEKAAESEQRFRSLIENAPDGVVIIDESGKFKYISPNAERLFGYNEDEGIGKSGDEFTHPDDLPMVLKALETIYADPDKKPKLEYRFKRKNGEFRWIETTFINLLSDRAINGIVLNFSDITERKQIFEELLYTKEIAEESEKKYRLITEFAADVVWVLNLTTKKYVYISPSIFQLRGFSVEEAMNETLQDSMTPESLKIVKDAITKNTKYFIEHPEANNYYMNEIQQTCKNGQIIWVEISTKFRYSLTGDIVVVGVSRNIDERKQTEEALREEKAFQGTLLDLTKSFLNTSLVDFDTVIEDMLGKAGEFSKVDRVYLFMHDHLRRVTSNSHEWCKEGITPEKDNLQEIPFDFFSDMLDAWEKGEMVHIPSVAQMSEEHAMRAILENQGIQSLILIPLNQGKENIGFIGFDVVDQCKSFTEREIALLLVMAEIISNAFTRKRAEEALKESESQFRLLFECAADAIFIADAESGILVNANNTAVNLLNISIDDIIGKHQSELHPPEMSNYSKATFQKYKVEISEEKLAYSVEIFVLRSDGTQIPVEITGSRVLYKGRDCIMGIFRDITERKQAEKALLAKMDELERFHKLTVGRELTMIELKKEVNNLLKKLGEDPKYKIVE